MTITDPCRICQSPVRLVEREEPRRLCQQVADTMTVRTCTSSSCPSNTGKRRIGQKV